METIWLKLKEDWSIKKYQIKNLEIDPNKDWYEITLSELQRLAAYLEVTVSEIIE